ncbi:DUF1028 domain-containing protein, partial [Candidatus Bipolaricaulota bacterium]|nr:DUF1028 domain-containing protein [Candidatus Bipolaricaulota bacterium]
RERKSLRGSRRIRETLRASERDAIELLASSFDQERRLPYSRSAVCVKARKPTSSCALMSSSSAPEFSGRKDAIGRPPPRVSTRGVQADLVPAAARKRRWGIALQKRRGMTFSIVAVDREARETGFAIASCCWDAGQVCLARADAGAIASQAQGNLSFLSSYFDKLGSGMDLPSILEAFHASDDSIESRQLGMVSFDHGALAFTGEQCSRWAGHRTGEDFACQGNILTGPNVIDAMVETFQSAEGTLFERLFVALEAGNAAGGDQRGKQSARLAVKKKGWGDPGTDSMIDIRIEDHDDPVQEMGRILGVRRTLAGILGLFGKFSGASDSEKPAILQQAEQILQGKMEGRYLDWWEMLAENYYEIGEVSRAVNAYKQYLTINPALRSVLEEQARKGLLPEEIATALLK